MQSDRLQICALTIPSQRGFVFVCNGQTSKASRPDIKTGSSRHEDFARDKLQEDSDLKQYQNNTGVEHTAI
jgi:hypothetical protein